MSLSPSAACLTGKPANVTRPSGPPGALTIGSVVSAYRRLAPIYDWLFKACFGPGQQLAVELLDQAPGKNVLEVGVGTGLTLPLWRQDTRLTGIDICPSMLQRAENLRPRCRLEHVQLLLMDAQATTFADNQFDKIAALYVVSVVPDLSALLREMQRICRPGGRIIIVNHFASAKPFVRSLENRLAQYSSVLGFNTALPLDRITQTEGLRVLRSVPVNWGGYWTLLEMENVK